MNDGPRQDSDVRTRLYEQAARLARLGAWECELATERVTWTEGAYDLFGLSLGAPLRRPAIVAMYVDESRAAMEAARKEVIASGRSLALDVEIRTAHNETRWMRLFIDVAHADGRPVHLFGAKQDITCEREALIRLRHMAERDPLTGLANRAVFDARYRAMVGDTMNHSDVAALVLIDIDHFKRINDERGHAAGDACLQEAARRLRRVFADALLIARIGGDEFAVLLRAPLGPARIQQMLRRACEILCKPVVWDGLIIEVGASIGATILGRPHLRKPTEVFAEADRALYASKAAGRNTVRVFGDVPHQSHAAPTTRSRVA